MEICLGMIGMQPSEFWDSSPFEVHCAIEGYIEMQGQETQEPLQRDELKELMELNPD